MKRSVYCCLTIWLLCLYDICGCTLSSGNTTRIKRDSEIKCTLPNYPDHGSWQVVNGQGKPGEEVMLNTIIKYTCDFGYKLSKASSYDICDNWNKTSAPTCLKLCPPVQSTATTLLNCRDIDGMPVSCIEAPHGTYLTYDCVAYYEAPFGSKQSLSCRDGQWSHNIPFCQPVCGKKVIHETSLILMPKQLIDIKYPWTAAIYQRPSDSFTFVCVGSIISRNLILTAAHCLTDSYGDLLNASEFRVGVGKFYHKYGDPRDIFAQYYEVRKLIKYPRYNGEIRRFRGDIGIIVIKEILEWGMFVQPVCISNVDNIRLRDNDIGEIAGWGINANGTLYEEIRELLIPYKSQMKCASELPVDWETNYNTEDKMCAGFFRRNVSICRGDGGGGLVFRNPEDNRYYIHGVASVGPTLNGVCDIQQNSLYSRVSYYYEFIDREINHYYDEICILPKHPTNGYYIVGNNSTNKLPGDRVAGSSLLTVSCNTGFTLQPPISTVECRNATLMPKCLPNCPLPDLKHTASHECVGHEEH